MPDGVLVTSEHRTPNPFKPFVEGDVNGVKEPSDLSMRPVVEGLRLPEPCPVKMRGGTTLTRPPNLRGEILPGRQQPTNPPLRQLNQQSGEGLSDLLKIVKREQLSRLTSRLEPQPVDRRVPTLLPQIKMIGGMRDEGRPTDALSMNTQSNLLSHGPAGKEERTWLTKQLGKPSLKPSNRRIGAEKLGIRRQPVKHPPQHGVWPPPQRRMRHKRPPNVLLTHRYPS